MEAPGTTKNQKVDEVHQLIQTLGKRKEEKKGDGEAEWKERRNDTVDFTIWWLISGGLGDEGGNKGGT